MAIYITVAIFMAILGKSLAYNVEQDRMYADRKQSIKSVCLMILLVLVLAYALRGTTGTDAGGYRRIFKSIYAYGTSLSERIADRRDDLFAVVEYFGSTIFKGSWFWGCVVYALFIYVPVLYVVVKESEDVQFSLLYYVLSLSAFSGYNGVKQALSMSFAFLGYCCFLSKRKYFGYAVCMIMAYMFHAAALIFVPFHLLSRLKLRSKLTFLAIAGLLVGVVAFDSLTSFLADATTESSLNEYFTGSFTGASWLRVAVALIPIILYYTNPVNKEYPDEELDHRMILAIVTAILCLYATKNKYYIRVSSYCSIMELITYPQIINRWKNSASSLRTIIIVMYIAYFLIFLLRGDSNLYPYIPIWQSSTW